MQVYNLPLAKRNSLRIVFKGWREKVKNIPHEGVFRGKLLLGGKAEDMSER